ncbi:uncharacterized protein V6R79_015877 [Siganus canaliculatus]
MTGLCLLLGAARLSLPAGIRCGRYRWSRKTSSRIQDESNSGPFQAVSRVDPDRNSRGGCHEDDLLQHSSPIAGQHGFCSSLQRGHQWLISAALEANADIDTPHSGLGAELSQTQLHLRALLKHLHTIPAAEGRFKK